MEPARASTGHVDVTRASPVVSGTAIKINQIASEYEHMGMTPDEIVLAHPHLTLADVHAALAYYYDHLEAIRDEWRKGQVLIDTLRDSYLSRLTEKLKR